MPRLGGYTYWPGFELEIKDSGQLVESGLRVPDKTWRFIDDAGHGHFWRDGYPTLQRIEPGCSAGHGDDCPGDVYYVCRLCGMKVVPITLEDPPYWIAGPITYRLVMATDGGSKTWRFDQERWVTLNDMVRAAVEDALGEPDEMTFHN